MCYCVSLLRLTSRGPHARLQSWPPSTNVGAAHGNVMETGGEANGPEPNAGP